MLPAATVPVRVEILENEGAGARETTGRGGSMPSTPPTPDQGTPRRINTGQARLRDERQAERIGTDGHHLLIAETG